MVIFGYGGFNNLIMVPEDNEKFNREKRRAVVALARKKKGGN